MSNYIGVRCPVCNKKYTQADDVVVCPICGAPHHRECYAQKSECAFASEHMSGKEWRAPPPDTSAASAGGEASASAAATCPSCGSQNPGEVIFCQVCGRRVSDVRPNNNAGVQGQAAWGFHRVTNSFDPVSMVYGGLSPDEKLDGETVRDFAVYIGESTAYYLPKFKGISENTRPLSFNFAALIFNFFYFFYRKMYSIGAFLLILFIVGAVPSFLQAHEMLPQLMYNLGLGPEATVNQALISKYQTMVNVTGTINFMIGVAVSFFANRFYFIKAVSEVKKIREESPEPHDEIAYNRTLSQKGGVSRISVLIAVGALIVLYFLAVSVMSYQYMQVGGMFIR